MSRKSPGGFIYRGGIVRLLTPLLILAAPAIALADDSTPQPDARLLGYKGNVALTVGGTELAWFALIGLGIVCVGVLFLSAKRTHLD